jgi:ribosome-associated translation inhibitor RaiA
MNNGISFKFNFETDNYDIAHDMIQHVLHKISSLSLNKSGYKSVELNLSRPGNEKKTACLTIHAHDSVIREESREEEWERAIDMVFDHVSSTEQHSIKLD